MIAIDFQNMESFSSDEDIVEHIEDMISYFRYHNKNLTKSQYDFIAFLSELEGNMRVIK